MAEYRIGELRELVILQRKTTTPDAIKGFASTWANVSLVWAKIEPLRAAERVAAAVLSLSAFRVVIRYRVDVAPAEMRFLRPVQPLTVTSITRSGTTATVTMSAAHNLASGATVAIAGAVETAYNGTIEQITVPDGSTTTFTFTVAGSPNTPATGTITATQYEILEIAGAPRPTADRMFLAVECQEAAA